MIQISIQLDDAALARSKELKVRVPTSQYLRLHVEKIMKGTSISGIVVLALEQYFQASDAEEAPEA